MTSSLFSTKEQQQLLQFKQAFSLDSKTYHAPPAGLIISETVAIKDPYPAIFQHMLQLNLAFRLLSYLLQYPETSHKELTTIFYISEAHVKRVLKRIEQFLLNWHLPSPFLRSVNHSFSEISKRTLLILCLTLETSEWTVSFHWLTTCLTLIKKLRCQHNESINRFASNRQALSHLLYPHLYFSEAGYLYLWKIILGLEQIVLDHEFLKKITCEINHSFTITQQYELQRLYLLFQALYSDPSPQHPIWKFVCKRYIYLSSHFPELIETYSLLPAMLLFS